jgi:citrate synthase
MPDDDSTLRSARDWWRTELIDIEPGVIRLRGYPIQELIGNLGFAQVVWLLLRGEVPSAAQAALLEAAMVASVDHGPQAPSIAIARMAATCGIGLQSAVASGVNALGDVHGGAGEACLRLLIAVDEAARPGEEAAVTVRRVLAERSEEIGRYVPGFGHRFHPLDPRVPRLAALTMEAAQNGTVDGRFVAIGRALEAAVAERAGKPVPMNIDGITAVVYAELGFAAPLARGLFVLSRSVGILAHAWEQTQQGGRIKGPTPPAFLYTYDGPPERHLTVEAD